MIFFGDGGHKITVIHCFGCWLVLLFQLFALFAFVSVVYYICEYLLAKLVQMKCNGTLRSPIFRNIFPRANQRDENQLKTHHKHL